MLSSITKIGNNQISQLKQNQQSPIQEGYQKYLSIRSRSRGLSKYSNPNWLHSSTSSVYMVGIKIFSTKSQTSKQSFFNGSGNQFKTKK